MKRIASGAVSETALVYIARHRNLAISAAMLVVQVGLSVVLILAMRRLGVGCERRLGATDVVDDQVEVAVLESVEGLGAGARWRQALA